MKINHLLFAVALGTGKTNGVEKSWNLNICHASLIILL